MAASLYRGWRAGLLMLHGIVAACDHDAFDEHFNVARRTSVIEMRVCPDEQVLDAQSLLVDVVFSAQMVSIEPVDGELWANGAWRRQRTCVAPAPRKHHTNSFSILVRPTGPSSALEVTAWELPDDTQPPPGLLVGRDCSGPKSRIVGRRYLLLTSAVAKNCRTVFEPMTEAGTPNGPPSPSVSDDPTADPDSILDAAPPTASSLTNGGELLDATTPDSNPSASVEPANSTDHTNLDGGRDAD